MSNPSFFTESSLLNVSSAFLNGSESVRTMAIAPVGPPLLKTIHDYLITTLLVAVMFAMGCSITLEEVWNHVRRPYGILTGMISQFLLLPFSAYCLVHVLAIDPLHAAGLLILASSPGGVTSNIFTFFCDGDVSLSVTMTSISTIAALVMMPFNIWLYGRSLESDTIVIPYASMTTSLFFLTLPVLFGMIVFWKWPKVAPFLTKFGSIAGFLIIIVCEAMEVMIFPDIFDDIPAKLYIAEVALPVLGLALGFGCASIFSLPYASRRTVAIECGVQNVGTALAIVSLSYPFEQLRKVWLFPFLYAFSMLGVCVVMAVVYQTYKHLAGKKVYINDDIPSNRDKNIVTVEVMSMPKV
ncbi:ileal sodium/bile acid cotransporter-like isoform X2 [Tetranychus urticae]|uniref:ileal sodium/bile acid cotransporter-like isoform X2 n=1 Tax=Tetranychus urticae TaxID=32264 RepID=UPI00077BCABA|nr:ileal sodium/bile acid cotransporter-like isoform X2 [Tetranychus urticae]